MAATVLVALPHALYLRCHDGSVLPVVTGSGLRLPTALVLASPESPHGWDVQPGDPVWVGDGEVRLPRATVRAVRTWAPVPFGAALAPPEAVSLVADGASGQWQGVALSLARMALRGDDVTQAVAGLVGNGPGLTPSGDDVLCGLLLGLQPVTPARDRVWAAVALRLGATTSLSAALLGESAAGYAVPAVLRLGSALVGGSAGYTDDAQVRRAVREVVAIGHSSGADLLAGLAAALRALAELVRRYPPAAVGVPA
ncbi:oxamate carbamoyltransferase subunit AllH family protein [Pedococcus sp. 2YAF34]|uniref:oxamate carbamoyltransferase subunit AllH family protein n=1 Tax=Pedococcus sp. 2YAF34 TaxID=3233032 RepID=UPI003F9999F6